LGLWKYIVLYSRPVTLHNAFAYSHSGDSVSHCIGEAPIKGPLTTSRRTMDDAHASTSPDGSAQGLDQPPRKKQKRNKPTLSCIECVERKTKVSGRDVAHVLMDENVAM
jgi:hypothetical protein